MAWAVAGSASRKRSAKAAAGSRPAGGPVRAETGELAPAEAFEEAQASAPG